jgi:His-Xaa-Ser system protein HxsD
MNECANAGNITVSVDGASVELSVNPKIYPLDVVLSAAYLFTDKHFVSVDGDPATELFIEIRPKDASEDLETIARLFNNELINYATYAVQTIKNEAIREAIIKRVLLTTGVADEKSDVGKPQKAWAFDDPDGIAKPWEEQHGKRDHPRS